MSRMLRVFGIVALINGVATPLLGSGRTRWIVDWWANQGGGAIRLFGLPALGIGGLIAYALVGNSRAA